MMDKNEDDRRNHMRLAGQGEIEAVTVDRFDHPIEALRETEVINISPMGMAMATSSTPTTGSIVKVSTAERDTFHVETLDCREWLSGKNKVRCRLVQGHMPANLIHSW